MEIDEHPNGMALLAQRARTELEIDSVAEGLTDVIQCARVRSRTEAYLMRPEFGKRVLLAVADLQHLNVHDGQRKEIIVRAILDERFSY